MGKRFFTIYFIISFINLNAQPVILPSQNTVKKPVVDSREVLDPNKTDNYAFDNQRTLAETKTNTTGLSSYGAGMNSIQYQVADIYPTVHFKSSINLNQVGNIKLIDVRTDQSKVGYLPINSDYKRKGIKSVGIQIKQSPLKWLTENFINNYILTDSSNKRELVIVLNKCWFSNDATEPFKSSNNLKISLSYSIDVYTKFNFDFYPQKKVEGSITTLYNNGVAYNQLLDSLILVLGSQVFTNQYTLKETKSNQITQADFNFYYNKKKQLVAETINAPKGVYKSYQDFLNRSVYSDSVEIIHKYDNAGRVAMYATEISTVKNEQVLSCNKLWGFYDGGSLYLNTGNGFYIKLIRSGYNYIFFDLNNLREDRIKSTIVSSINIGKSTYEIIREYSRVTPLTYQLDPDTGILY